jgi:hypothetical protein
MTDDLVNVLRAGYKYPEGPGGFQLFLKGDPDFNNDSLDEYRQDEELDVSFYHPKFPAITSDLIDSVMRKMYFLIGIIIDGIEASMYEEGTLASELVDDLSGHVEELAPEYLKQRFEKFKKAKELFEKRTSTSRPRAVTQHVYDKLMKPMYKIFTTAQQKYNPAIDMRQIKEGKLKVSRRQLKLLIETFFRENLENFTS